MAQVKSKVAGEYTYPSDFSEIPDGGLINSKNINLDRPSVAEPRRGFNWYKKISTSSLARALSEMEYRDTLLCHYEVPATVIEGDITNASFLVTNIPSTANLLVGMNISGTGIPSGTIIFSIDSATQVTMTAQATATTADLPITVSGEFLSRDGSDPFTRYTGTYESPLFNGSYVPKMKGVEANRNFYFITNDGIKKLSSPTSQPTAAGMPAALDLELALTSVLSGFMSDDTQVAYRLVWAREDENDNLILGAPSGRYVIANTTGSSEDVEITASIPEGITTSDTYRIYRSAQTLNANITPNDELQLVIEDNPTSGEIAAKQFTVTDSTPDDLRGETIYTAESQEGIASANNTPPAGKDICTFKNMAFVANTKQNQSQAITLLSVAGSFGINVPVSSAGNTTNGSAIVTSIASTSSMSAGMRITGTGIPAGTTIASVDSGTQITMSANASANGVAVAISVFDSIEIAGIEYIASAAETIASRQFQVFTSGTPAQNIADTAQSLVRVVNRYSGNTDMYAYYVSGYEELPGRIFLQARNISFAAFDTQTYGHASAWTPNMESGVTSTSESKRNRLHVSKIQRYEAFPRAQYFDIGGADDEILRVIPLREVCIICKSDGFYRVVGDTPGNLQIDPIDLTASLVAPETAKPLANTIYALTTQGVASINDTGVGIISQDIENQITPLFAYDNVGISFGVSYETDRAYLMWVPFLEDDTVPGKVLRYNVFTRQWTQWEKEAIDAIVAKADDKLYYSYPTTNDMLQERKDRDYSDYADEDIDVVISSVSGSEVTLDALYTDIEVGDALVQSDTFIEILEISTDGLGNTVLTTDYDGEYTPGAAVVSTGYECIVAFAPQFCGNPGIMKQIREVQALFKRSDFRLGEFTFSTDIISNEEEVDSEGEQVEFWGAPPWGDFIWGGPETEAFKDRLLIPKQHQRCSWINTTFQIKAAFAYFEFTGLEYTFEPMSERTQK